MLDLKEEENDEDCILQLLYLDKRQQFQLTPHRHSAHLETHLLKILAICRLKSSCLLMGKRMRQKLQLANHQILTLKPRLIFHFSGENWIGFEKMHSPIKRIFGTEIFKTGIGVFQNPNL